MTLNSKTHQWQTKEFMVDLVHQQTVATIRFLSRPTSKILQFEHCQYVADDRKIVTNSVKRFCLVVDNRCRNICSHPFIHFYYSRSKVAVRTFYLSSLGTFISDYRWLTILFLWIQYSLYFALELVISYLPTALPYLN